MKDKLEAIRNIKAPSNIKKKLQTILGIATYLNSYSSKLADLTSPLRELTRKLAHFRWEPHHKQALDRMKQELCSAKIISYYDPDPATPTILQCDASDRCWSLAEADSQGNENIVAIASRSLTDAKSRYPNIKHECLVVTYGLEKFSYYLLGRTVAVETDHSPLEQIFKKSLNEAPSRLQRLLLKCLRFDIHVQYKRGRSILVADALSRCAIEKGAYSMEDSSDNPAPHCSIHFLSTPGGVVVSVLHFRSEGWWFDAQSLPLCCFLRQDTLPHIVSLQPGV